jgi:hypothetical protein
MVLDMLEVRKLAALYRRGKPERKLAGPAAT